MSRFPDPRGLTGTSFSGCGLRLVLLLVDLLGHTLLISTVQHCVHTFCSPLVPPLGSQSGTYHSERTGINIAPPGIFFVEVALPTLKMASHGHRRDPSKMVRPVSGLGIARPGLLPRQVSHHALIENSAPIAGHSAEAEDAYSDARGGRISPESSPEIDFRDSIHSAWDLGATRGIYAQLDEERNSGAGGSRRRDLDTMSLDSLQMRDLDSEDPQNFDRGFTTVREIGRDGEEEAFETPRARSTPLVINPRLKRAPTNVRIERRSWPAVWLLMTSIYSTIFSGIWLITAIVEPRWGSTISTNGPVPLSTANLLIAVFAKTIEMSFVTVTVAFIGQVLTRRAIAAHEGMTMAEMTMRTWITQPSTVLFDLQIMPYAARNLLGIVTIMATLVAMFYTTASDTMVRPKLQFSKWQHKHLNSTIFASYANPTYVNDTCTTPVSVSMDSNAGATCLAIQYSGDSFSDFMDFISTWRDTNSASLDIAARPRAQSMLYNNVTMVGTWIETQFSNVSKNFETHSRVINNVSLAMPHPGVYKAATNRTLNGILQPSDLDGVGSYNVSASVVSPAVNVLCVNMDSDELKPLINNGSDSTSNSTVVDDIFLWGEQYDRNRPSFPKYAPDYNTLVNDTMAPGNISDAIYILGKNPQMDNYTLCELRSWPAIQCSTSFNVSGSTRMAMSAECSQDVDYYPENATLFTSNPDAYVHTMKADDVIATSMDWKDMLELWTLAINLNGGLNDDNAANARILTGLALTQPQLNDSLPSMAEALAAMISNTLITGSINTPFIHYWDYNETMLSDPAMVTFATRVRSQAYASWHTEAWQGIFYVILAFAFLLNLVCLAYLLRVGLVKDFLEPTSLFALATARTNSMGPGPGPVSRESTLVRTPDMEKLTKKGRAHLVVPWRLSYKPDADHFVFEEAAGGGGVGVVNRATGTASGMELEEGVGKKKSYARLSGKALF